MKGSSKPKFDNIPLKQWLLKVGPIRRKTLLQKFKNNLIRLGLGSRAVRTGLLQLSSRPFVSIFRNSAKQITRDNAYNSKIRKERSTKIDENKKLSRTEDPNVNEKHNDRGMEFIPEQLLLKNKSQERESLKKSKHKSRSKKRSQLKEGENPNGITWKLCKIDMVNDKPNPPVSVSLLKRYEEERKIREERLLAKFVDIFGDDGKDVSDEESNSERSSEYLENWAEENDSVPEDAQVEEYRKSPTFCGKEKKRKRFNDRSNRIDHKKQKSEKYGSLTQNTVISHGATDRRNVETARDDANQNDVLITKATTQCGGARSLNDKLEKELRDLGLISESENESVATKEAPVTSMETLPATRQHSVIFKLDKRGESVPVTPVPAEVTSTPALELEKSTEKEADHSALEAECSYSLDASRVPKKEMPEIPNAYDEDSTDTIITPRNMDVKKEPDEPQFFNVGSTSSPRNSFDSDPCPSSTTGTEPSGINRSGLTGISKRLLGALDNIFLALLGRRRFRERQQAVSKLAIEENRRQEISLAKQEFDLKLSLFNQELFYLSNRIGSWEGVLSFIAEGLNNRTPSNVNPFTRVEIEAAMREAELKVPLNLNAKESSSIESKLSVGIVLCTIDLTQENHDEKVETHCDSSTDPSSSRNIKYEPPDLDISWDYEDNKIQPHLPSITEVRTISPQQFDTLTKWPCLLCSRVSHVACKQCAKAAYCSKNCQELHWAQTHHTECVPLKGVIRMSK